jgi:hypothetical protein
MRATKTRSLALAALVSGACASASLPPPSVMQEARLAASFSASLHVSLKGKDVRARARALVAFERPDALRVEVPGPSGARLIAVSHDGWLVAVFPGERAVFRSDASAASFEALLGIALTPLEVMDLLVGAPSPRLRSYDARWGARSPRQIEAGLPDGGTLKLAVEDAELGAPVPSAAFAEPAHDGYRAIDAREARSLWGAR